MANLNSSKRDVYNPDEHLTRRAPAPPTHARYRTPPRSYQSARPEINRSYAGRNAPRPRPAPVPSGRRRPRGNGGLIAVCCIAVAAACVLAVMLISSRKTPAPQTIQYPDPYYATNTVEATVAATDGTAEVPVIPGAQPVSLEEALNYWEDHFESKYANTTVHLSNGQDLTAASVGYHSDYEEVLTALWQSETVDPDLRNSLPYMTEEQADSAFGVSRDKYNELLVRDYVESLANSIYQEPIDASLIAFDAEEYKFLYSESQIGRELDVEATVRDIMQAFEDGGGSVELVVNTTNPDITTEELAASHGCIAYAETDASESKPERLDNIKLALSLLNGTSVKPGFTFSFNNTVGKRTKDRGFKEAPAYEYGTVTTQVGGGICQVSTTLFNALVKADMNITERHNHSLTVHYIDCGLDATVNWNTADLKFRNSSDEKVYICCAFTKDKKVRIGIFGKKSLNGETIKMIPVKAGDIPYETEYEPTSSLRPGSKKVIQSGKKGLKVDTYKVRYDADKNEISREKLFTSTYQPTKEIIQVGTEPSN